MIKKYIVLKFAIAIFGFVFFLVLVSAEVRASVSVVGELTREKTVECGENFEGSILLKNKASTFSQVKVYQTDYLFFADGKNIYGEAGSLSRSNAKWIKINPTRLDIPPGNTASVHYTVQVPKAKNLKGTYWSIIMIEEIPETSMESKRVKKNKVVLGIQTKIRYGVQMVTNISDTGASNIKILDKKLIREGRKKILQLDIENKGERWLSPFVWVELYNKGGKNVGRFEGNKVRIYPGCSVRHKIDLAGVPNAKYKALVIVDNGDGYVFGARYNLRIK